MFVVTTNLLFILELIPHCIIDQTQKELDCHIVREKVSSGLIHPLPVSSVAQLTDIYTKTLVISPFQVLVSKLRMVDIHSPVCEGGRRGCGGRNSIYIPSF